MASRSKAQSEPDPMLEQDAVGEADPVTVRVVINRALYRRFRRFCAHNDLEPSGYMRMLFDAALRQDEENYEAFIDTAEYRRRMYKGN